MDRATLDETRTRLQQRLADLGAATEVLRGEGAGQSSELSHVTQHPGDVGSEVADNDREQAMLDNEQQVRGQIAKALARLDDGTYGTCEVCGQQIPAERLQERPEATTDVQCAAGSPLAR